MRAWRKCLQQRRNVGNCLSSCPLNKHNLIKSLRASLDERTLSGHDVLDFSTAQNFSYAKFRVMPSRTYSKLTQSEYEAQTTFHNHGPSNDALHTSEAVHHCLKCMSGLEGALKTGIPLPEQT